MRLTHFDPVSPLPIFGPASHASWHSMGAPPIFHTLCIYPFVIRQQGYTTKHTDVRSDSSLEIFTWFLWAWLSVVNINNIMWVRPQTFTHFDFQTLACLHCIDTIPSRANPSKAWHCTAYTNQCRRRKAVVIDLLEEKRKSKGRYQNVLIVAEQFTSKVAPFEVAAVWFFSVFFTCLQFTI